METVLWFRLVLIAILKTVNTLQYTVANGIEFAGKQAVSMKVHPK